MRTDSVGGIVRLQAFRDQRAAFAVPDGVTFLNSAHIGPRLHAVRAAEKFALDRWAMPWTLTGEDWFTDTQRLRELVGGLLRADAEALAFVPSVSYAMAVVARNVRVTRGQSIVVIHEEFPSNYYAWETVAAAAGARLKIVARAPSQSWPDALVDAITDDAAVVSVPVCHWTDGALIGVERVGARARAVGAALVVDASQSLGMLPLDAPALDADFVIATGYKWLLGPFGLAYLYVAARHRCGEPIEQAWPARKGSEDLSRLVEYRSSFRPGARRFDAGEHQNSLLLPMALAAVTQVVAWQADAASILDSMAAVTDVLAECGTAEGLSPTPAAWRAPHFLGFRTDAARAAAIAGALREQQVFVSARGDTIRVAPHLHTTTADVARFAAALRRAR